MTERRILRLSGPDTRDFLQGLITNDIARIDDGLVYAAMLTPQGKLVADFFLKADGPDGRDALLDVSERFADGLAARLSAYRLRAAVEIAESGLALHRGTGTPPSGLDALPDPRHERLGWRAYAPGPASDDGTDWDALRVELCIPESGVELDGETYVLEAGFEALNGVDFAKGCYVGQEVTARMKHKTELRKGLRAVSVEGAAEPGTDILCEGKPVGRLHTVSGPRAIAYLRLDRISGEMKAGDAVVALA